MSNKNTITETSPRCGEDPTTRYGHVRRLETSPRCGEDRVIEVLTITKLETSPRCGEDSSTPNEANTE